MKLAALVPGLALAGCGGSKTLLSPKDPTMLSIWHVYGEQEVAGTSSRPSCALCCVLLPTAT